MFRTTIYLDAEVRRRVRLLAQARGRTQAAVIREALMEYTGTARKPRSIGMGRSGSGDLSERADQLLAGFGEDR